MWVKLKKKIERGPRVGNGDEKNGGSKGTHNMWICKQDRARVHHFLSSSSQYLLYLFFLILAILFYCLY